MPVLNRIAAFHADMTEWRHDLHAHPELALQETRTSGVVQDEAEGIRGGRGHHRPRPGPGWWG